MKRGGVSSSSFLGSSKGWGLGLEIWTPLDVVVLVWLTGRWGMTAAWILRGGYADSRGYVKQVKLVWPGVFEIPCFVVAFGIPGACLA